MSLPADPATVSTDPTLGMILSAGRTLGAFVGGWLVAKGYVSHQQLLEIGPALGTLAVAGFGMYSHWKAKQELKTMKAN